jgi:hypothetical protein
MENVFTDILQENAKSLHVNDVNQDFSLKYSNNKMGINDVINKMSINNTRADLLH